MNRLLGTLLAATLLCGCAASTYKPPKHQAIPIANPRKLPPSRALVITSPVTGDTLEWGAPYEIPLDILWLSGRSIPVRLVPAAGTPAWLKVSIDFANLDTAAHAIVTLLPLAGQAPTGKLQFVIEAVSDSFPQPVRKEFSFYVRRQTGVFTRLQFGIESRACDSVCAQVSPTGELDFYDQRQSPGLACTDSASLPESQRIGTQGIPLSRLGYTLGSSCLVAAAYDATGMLTFVNLGISPRVPLGAVLLSLRGASACWLSPDNTMALVAMPGAALPYEIATGRLLGGPCRLTSDTLTVRIHNGSILRAGLCKWELQ